MFLNAAGTKVANVRGFMTSTGSSGTNFKVWVAEGEEDPALNPFTVRLQAAATETRSWPLSAAQP